MIITRPREWERVRAQLADLGATSVYIMGCGQCATVASTGGEVEVVAAKARLEQEGVIVTGWSVGEVTCHAGGQRLEVRKHAGEIEAADAVLVLACGAGVQTVADTVAKPVTPGLESVFLGNVIRHGVFEERCQMCGDCVLDRTAGICPVTTCPKGLLNGPCGGMWNGMCEVVADRECAHVLIRRRLAEQGRAVSAEPLPPKDYSK
jgi:ferredoxin